jgi:hypothetical protein
VHDTIDQFVHLEPAVRTKEKLDSLFDSNWSFLSGKKGGFTDDLQEQEFRSRANAMLDRFYSHPHFKIATPHKIPSFPKLYLGPNLILTGKLDWLEKTDTGFSITDFKTGKNEEKEDSQQLPIYAVLVRGIVNSDHISANYWYLDKATDPVPFALPDLQVTTDDLRRQGEIIALARQTESYRCQSGNHSCWACRDMMAIKEGLGTLVTIDSARKQEIYILPKIAPDITSDLPF